MTTFTKGPWVFTPDEWDDGSLHNKSHSIGSITTLDEDGDQWFIARIDNMAEEQANARLIAAAPELYEACRTALMTLNINRRYIECAPLEERLKAAIAKADGVQ